MNRIALVDNHEAVREGVAARIERAAPDLSVVASVATVEELVDVEAGVVLLDLWLEGGSTLDAIPGLVASGRRVLLYTTEQRPVPVRRAIEAGATGLLLKSDPLDTVIDGIRAAATDDFYCSGTLAHALLSEDEAVVDLSPRQIEILEALADGLDYRATAALLDFAEASVKTHLGRIREKFRAVGIEPRNSHHLTKLAKEQGHLE